MPVSTRGPASWTMSKPFLVIAIVLTLLSIFSYYPDTMGDSDLWWHLKYGEIFVRDHTVDLDDSVFSWTPTITDWTATYWLAQTILYEIYHNFSYPGLWLLQWLFYAGSVWLCLDLIRRLKSGFDILPLTAILMVFVAIKPTAIFIKPEIFTTIFFVITLYLYFMAKFCDRERFWLLPPIFLLWGNCHGAYIVGGAFLVLMISCEFLAGRFGVSSALTKQQFRRLLTCAVLSLAAIVINPDGIADLIYLFSQAVGIGDQGTNIHVAGHLNRWRFLFPNTMLLYQKCCTAWLSLLMMATYLLLTWRVWRRSRVFDPVLLVLNVAFFFFAMGIARAVLFFPFIWLFSIFTLIRHVGPLDHSRMRLAMVPLLALLLLCGPYYLTAIHYSNSWAGSALDEILPTDALAFARQHKLPEPIFNDYLSGGHMIAELEGQKVFIDSRFAPYENQILRDYTQFMGNPGVDRFNRLEEKYEFASAFINHASAFTLAMPLVKSPDWVLVYTGKVASIFMRREVVGPELTAIIAANTNTNRFTEITNWKLLYGLFYIYLCRDPAQSQEIFDIYENNVSPLFFARKIHLAKMKQALDQATGSKAQIPTSASEQDRLQATISKLYLSGRFSDARRTAQDYLARFKDDGGITYNLACIEARLGETENAWQTLVKALSLGYHNFSLIKRDPDLELVRQMKSFSTMLASFEKEAGLTRTPDATTSHRNQNSR